MSETRVMDSVPAASGRRAQHTVASETPPTPDICQADEREQLLALLHTEVRDLQTILEMARRGEIKLEDHASYIAKSVQDICQIIEQNEPNTVALRHLHDLWEQMRACPLLANPAGASSSLQLDEQLGHFTLLNDQFRKMIFQISEATIPRQLNCWLEQSRTGYYIPFHTLFSDQLPELEDRIKLLTCLAWTPGSVKGLVDVENGLVYRYADNKRERYFHFYLVLASLLISYAVAIGGGSLITSGTGEVSVEKLVLPWFALLIGIVVHRAIDSLKGKRPPIIAIGELGLLLSAIHGRIILKLLLALIAFFGLILMHADISLTPFNALLAGYSLDSVVEVFGNQLEKRSTAQITAFKQQLGLSDKG